MSKKYIYYVVYDSNKIFGCSIVELDSRISGAKQIIDMTEQIRQSSGDNNLIITNYKFLRVDFKEDTK